MKKKQKTPKEKRRNMEKRKLKSRDAARCRRNKETEIFTDLSYLLPISRNTCMSHLDKASIIRIAISYLKIRTIVQFMPESLNSSSVHAEMSDAASLFINALEGFLLVVNMDGDIVFISENVNRYLGFSQVDLLGQSIYEISHPCDHPEIKEMLLTKNVNSHKSYFLRMKCILTNKGRNVNIKSASYRVIHFSGRIIKTEIHPNSALQKGKTSNSENESSDSFHFITIAEPISHPANIEIPLGHNIFLTKHSLDMRFTYTDEKIIDFFGYDPKNLLDKSVFDYYHAGDIIELQNCFNHLFQKGQSQTESYRFLANGGGYAWVLSQATVINNNAQKPQSVVCVNFVISGVENKNEIYSLCQVTKENVKRGGIQQKLPQHFIKKVSVDTSNLTSEKLAKKVCPVKTAPLKNFESIDKESRVLRQEQPQSLSGSDFLVNCPKAEIPAPIKSNDDRSTIEETWVSVNEENTTLAKMNKHKPKESNGKRSTERVFNEAPLPATANVFVPFTEDMNKGFLGFVDNDKELTILPDDPEDLTHLAPTAGDVCVPLDETPVEYVLPDMLEEFILSDCKLFPNNPDNYLPSPTNSFFTYDNNLEVSPRTLSPLLRSNDDCSIPSLDGSSSPLSTCSVHNFGSFEGLIQSSDETKNLMPESSLLSIPLNADPILSDFIWDSSSLDDSPWILSRSPNSSGSLPNQSITNLISSYGDKGAMKMNKNNRSTSQSNSSVLKLSNNRTGPLKNDSNGKMITLNTKTVLKGVGLNDQENHTQQANNPKIDVTVGSKRSSSQNSECDDLCKRSKRTVKSVTADSIYNATETRTETMEATSITKQPNTVLMNLLIGNMTSTDYVCSMFNSLTKKYENSKT